MNYTKWHISFVGENGRVGGVVKILEAAEKLPIQGDGTARICANVACGRASYWAAQVQSHTSQLGHMSYCWFHVQRLM